MRVFILCGHGFRVEGSVGRSGTPNEADQQAINRGVPGAWRRDRAIPADSQPLVLLVRDIDRSGLRATQAPGELIRLGGGGRRTALQEFVSELENLFEIISPDAFLRPYLDDYDAIMWIRGGLGRGYYAE
jgi:hypothetical protein